MGARLSACLHAPRLFCSPPRCDVLLCVQALTGQAIPAGTKEAPLPRVLALLPGVHLEAQHSTDFRWRRLGWKPRL